MFGFLIGGLVNDDAVKLITFTEMSLNKYGTLSTGELLTSIQSDFKEDHFHISDNRTTFVFGEIPEFQFSFEKRFRDEKGCTLTAFGKGKYAGLMLQVIDGDQWQCSVSDGILYRATGGAKKMAKILRKKFDVQDISKFMKSF